LQEWNKVIDETVNKVPSLAFSKMEEKYLSFGVSCMDVLSDSIEEVVQIFYYIFSHLSYNPVLIYSFVEPKNTYLPLEIPDSFYLTEKEKMT